MSNTGNLGILFRNAFCCINNNNYHISTFHRCYCTDNTVTFQFFLDFVLSAQSGCIDKYIFFSVPLHFCINGISGRSCNIGYNHTVFTKKLIDNGRLSDIWLSDYSDLRSVILFLFCRRFREQRNHLIQQISKSLLIHRRDREWITNSQIIKFIYIRQELLMVVNFIYCQYHRLMGTAQHICYLGIRIHQALLHIYHEQNHICGINGDLSLFSHLGQNDVITVRFDTTGIN